MVRLHLFVGICMVSVFALGKFGPAKWCWDLAIDELHVRIRLAHVCFRMHVSSNLGPALASNFVTGFASPRRQLGSTAANPARRSSGQPLPLSLRQSHLTALVRVGARHIDVQS